jgi:hypothetical protein
MSRNVYCKCIIISRRQRFVNLILPALKIIGVRRRSICQNIMPVPGNIAKKVEFEKLTGFLNHKPNLTGKCVVGLEHFEIAK